MPKVKNKCQNCGKEFSVYPSVIKTGGGKYCSPECYNGKKIKCICKRCGKEFETIPSEIKKGGGKYCCRECFFGDRIKCICKQCGKEFEVIPADIRKGGGKYCSKDCYYIAKKGIPQSEESCKKISAAKMGHVVSEEQRAKQSATLTGKYRGEKCPSFGKSKSEHQKIKQREVMTGRYNGERNPFYQRKHSEEALKKMSEFGRTRIGEKNPAWRNGASFEPYCEKFDENFKERVRSFFSRQCALCGLNERENGQKLCVHHIFIEKMACCENKIEEMEEVRKRLPSDIVRFGEIEFSDIEITYIRMMVPLCKKCHGKPHGRYNEAKYRNLFSTMIMEKYGGKCFYTKEEFVKLARD